MRCGRANSGGLFNFIGGLKTPLTKIIYTTTVNYTTTHYYPKYVRDLSERFFGERSLSSTSATFPAQQHIETQMYSDV